MSEGEPDITERNSGQHDNRDHQSDEEPFSASESDYIPSSESESTGNESDNEGESVLADVGIQAQPTEQTMQWVEVTGSSLRKFVFTGRGKINIPPNLTPVEIYKLIVELEILDLIVLETNSNASRCKQNWKEVSVEEMQKFFAILLFMGLVKYPKISDYWSKKFLYRHCFVRHIMSRNRFQSILRFLHFADNEAADTRDRLYKIKPLTNALTKRYKQLKIPEEVVSIDESMVPFRGRLQFRQYIPGKASKYGVKIFKLCDETGYTYETEIYKGKSSTETAGRKSNTIVLNLMKDYLDQGRTLVADNYYNNLQLTDMLLERKTHNVGTLRKYVKGIPKNILDAKKMKKGEVMGKENTGKIVGNWKDKRNVRFITTRHTLNVIDTNKKNRKGEKVNKPEAIVFYNKFKMGIDLSDQMSSYFSVLRRSIRWYHKVAFEYLFGTSVVNALILYQISNNKKIQISDFREKLVMGLLGDIVDKEKQLRKPKHLLKEMVGKTKDNRKKRKRCVGCYEEQYKLHKQSKIAAQKAKLVSTFCSECTDTPALCLQCFQSRH